MELSTEIRQARVALGLSQAAAATAWGVSLGTIRAWEQGVNQPRGLALAKLREIIATAMAAKPAAPAPSGSHTPASAVGSPRPAQAKAEVAAHAAQEQAPAPAQSVEAVARPFSCQVPRSRHSINWRTQQLIGQSAKDEAGQAAKAQTAFAPASAPRPDVAPASESPALTVKLVRDRFRIFERIAARERRPQS